MLTLSEVPLPVRGSLAALVGGTVALLIAPAAASAGNLIVTGHDADTHCGRGDVRYSEQCGFVGAAVKFARKGAPDSRKPVLVLTNDEKQAAAAVDRGAPGTPKVVVDPSSSQFPMTPLSTNNFSAIVIGSDETCYGCDLNDFGSTSDSDAINARAAEIRAFFNAGGGLFVNAGAQHGDGDPATGPDVFYNFLPIPVGAVAVNGPFKMGPAGRYLRLTDTDINCCKTHNAFKMPPAGSALSAVDTDTSGNAVSLATMGTIENNEFVAAPGSPLEPPQQVSPGAIGLPPARGCVDTRKFSFRLRNPRGRKATRVDVFINGKRKKVFRGKAIKRVSIKRLPKRRFVVRIVVTQDNGAKRATKRTYKGCKKGRVRRG